MNEQQKSFFQELTQRRVVQVALLYFAVAWTVTEVLSFLFGAIPVFPVWSKTLVAILFVLGFPVAMFLAWRFDIGPDGIKRTESGSTRGRMTVVLSLLLLVAGTAGLFYLIYPQVREQASRSGDTAFRPPENSIAVMSFLNMGSNPENEYFSQGVPDTILHKLANLSDLIVVARTSSFALSEGDMDATTIGKELNVHYLLEGSVQRVGDDLRIITQLINTPDGTHVWSLDQRLVLDDIFSVQDEIALEITRALELTLRQEERDRLLANGTMSVPAYLAFLRGNYAQQSRSIEQQRVALQHFDEAIEFDPAYARAYVSIARSYGHLGSYGAIDKLQSNALMRQYFEKALDYDDKLGEAYAGLFLMADDGRGTDEEKRELLATARTLSPNDPNVLRAYARSMCNGDDSVSCLETKAALQLDAIRRSPDDANLYFDMAWTMMLMGRPDDVWHYFSEAARRNPEMTTAYTRLARWNQTTTGDLVRSVSCLREAISRDPENSFPKIELSMIYVDLGMDHLAEQILDDTPDPHGAWRGFLQYARLKILVYRGEDEDALNVARTHYQSIADGGRQTEMAVDVLLEDAQQSEDFAYLIDHLEQEIGPGILNDYADIQINSIFQFGAVIPLVRVLEFSGNSVKADALKSAADVSLHRLIVEKPALRSLMSPDFARIYLWRGDIEKALDELETAARETGLIDWYVARTPGFEPLHGHPRFEALIDAAQSEVDAQRQRLAAADNDLPPCVSNMRAQMQ